jgi:hypothetical protein
MPQRRYRGTRTPSEPWCPTRCERGRERYRRPPTTRLPQVAHPQVSDPLDQTRPIAAQSADLAIQSTPPVPDLGSYRLMGPDPIAAERCGKNHTAETQNVHCTAHARGTADCLGARSTCREGAREAHPKRRVAVTNLPGEFCRAISGLAVPGARNGTGASSTRAAARASTSGCSVAALADPFAQVAVSRLTPSHAKISA